MANINLLYQSLHPGLEEPAGFGCDPGFALGFGQNDDAMTYANASELSAPEYSTDDFRVFSFKVSRCSKRFVHDWRCCPFAHPTENARRRDPRTVRYLPVPCPDYKRGICLRGDTCPYSHGVYECWLHPAKYKTQLCKEGPHCRRPVCFFAHSVMDLRQPSHLWDGNNAEGEPATVAAALLQQAPSDASTARLQSVAEEDFNNSDPSATIISSSQDGISAGSKQSSPPLSPTALSTVNSAGCGQDGSGNTATLAVSTPEAPQQQAVDSQLNSNGDGIAIDAINAVPQTLRPRGASFDIAGASDPSLAALRQPRGSSTSAVDALTLPTASSTASSLNGSINSAATGTTNGGTEPWAQKLAEGMSAAAAMSSIPVNERPMLPSSAPRMSNAVARKLGLAPQKPVTAPAVAPQTAPAMMPRGGSATMGPASPPPRPSIDGYFHQNAFSPPQGPSLEQQLAAAVMSHAQIQQSGMHNGNGNHFVNQQQPMGNAFGDAMNGTYGGGVPAGPHSFPPTAADGSSNIHPALLNLVAVHMTTNGNGNGVNVPHPSQSGVPMSNPGTPKMDDAAMAQLLHSVQGWGINNNNANGQTTHHGMNNDYMPHRGSSDGMLGVSGLPTMNPAVMVASNNSPFYLPTDLDAALNNQAGGGGGMNMSSSNGGSRHGSSESM